MLRNGTCILLYLIVPNTQPKVTHLKISQKAPNQSLHPEKPLKEIKGIWKKLLKYQNNPSNIGKWDFHSTTFQGP